MSIAHGIPWEPALLLQRSPSLNMLAFTSHAQEVLVTSSSSRLDTKLQPSSSDSILQTNTRKCMVILIQTVMYC